MISGLRRHRAVATTTTATTAEQNADLVFWRHGVAEQLVVGHLRTSAAVVVVALRRKGIQLRSKKKNGLGSKQKSLIYILSSD